jgi:hypothetical protein
VSAGFLIQRKGCSCELEAVYGGKMKRIFRLDESVGPEGQSSKTLLIGLDLRIGDQEIHCPISKPCVTYECMEEEVRTIQGSLEQILVASRRFFQPSQGGEDAAIPSDSSPEAAWMILSKEQDETLLMRRFNQLDEALRKKIAAHVFTNCSVFSGLGSFFSVRYNNVSGLLE